ncbi:hypothetical protein [Microbacterium sp. LWH3-1.2]|uniref:hypothetical protein n=1 Tax=Microbacterium sp. LWH3-1.2 TaxID=3135256 RepID=UPI00341A31DD
MLRAGAWATPVILVAAQTPLAVASEEPAGPVPLTLAVEPVTTTGEQLLTFEVANPTPTSVASQVMLVLTPLGSTTLIEAEPIDGWTITISPTGTATAVGVLAPGASATIGVRANVQPLPNGSVASATLFESGEAVAGETAVIDGFAETRPAVVRSFGPNGTHWPAHTPWIGAAAAHTVDVDCTWAAIGAAIRAVTAEQAAAGVHIRVRPGTLPGNGSSSGSTPVLRGMGNANWGQNVLISPLEGWGSVTISAPARLRDVHGVTFARINGDRMLLTNGTRSAWAQSRFTTGFSIASSYNAVTENCGAYEIVVLDPRTGIADPLGYAAGAGSTLDKSVFEGCYVAPVFRPVGATDHLDTLQMYGSGWYRGLTVRDSTFFGSRNCALQIGGSPASDPRKGTPFVTVDHSVLTSQATAVRVRYSQPDGTEPPTINQAINGSGEPGQLHAYDSYVFGSIYESTWGTVRNTRVSSTGRPANDGAFTADLSLEQWGAAEFDELTPAPTDAYLAQIWS